MTYHCVPVPPARDILFAHVARSKRRKPNKNKAKLMTYHLYLPTMFFAQVARVQRLRGKQNKHKANDPKPLRLTHLLT